MQAVELAAVALVDRMQMTWDPASAPEPLFAATVDLLGEGLEGDVVFQPVRKLEHCIAAGDVHEVWWRWDPPGFAVQLPRRLDPTEGPTLPAVSDDARAPVWRRAFELLSERWGLVVVGEDGGDWRSPEHRAVIASSLAAAQGPDEVARWRQRGWLAADDAGHAPQSERDLPDATVCAVRRADGRLAAVIRTDAATLRVVTALGGSDPRFGKPVEGRLALYGDAVLSSLAAEDDVVVAGLCPEGTRRAVVRDERGAHDAVVGEGAYIATVLRPSRPYGRPQMSVDFLDAAGSLVASSGASGSGSAVAPLAVDDVDVPALWSQDLPGVGRLLGEHREGGVRQTATVESKNATVITTRAGEARPVEELAREQLDLDVRRARATQTFESTQGDLTVTVDGGHVARSAVAAAAGHYVVVAFDPDLALRVEVQARGPVPQRLRLQPLTT